MTSPAVAMATLKMPSQKVILCGEYGVGKSSLFRRFAMDTFVSASDRRSTLGLDQYEKVYTVGPDERQIKVCTGGILFLTPTACELRQVYEFVVKGFYLC